MDAEKLLLSISEGKAPSEQELAQVLELLNHEAPFEDCLGFSLDDAYSCLLILGRAKLTQYRHIVERYLLATDPLTIALVLEILCLDWGFTEDYLEQVISFALGVPGDSEQDAQHTALKILGEFLYQNRGCKVVNKQTERQVSELLNSIFTDESAQQWTRQAAYYAMCRACGHEWTEIPPECKVLNLRAGTTDLKQEVIDYISRLSAASEIDSGPESEAGK